MKYATPDELLSAHIADIIDSCDSSQAAIKLAQTQLLTIMFTANDGDTEKVIEGLKELHKLSIEGIDNGDITCASLQ